MFENHARDLDDLGLYGAAPRPPLLKRFLSVLSGRLFMTFLATVLVSVMSSLGWIRAIIVWIASVIVAVNGPPEASESMKKHISTVIGTAEGEQAPGGIAGKVLAAKEKAGQAVADKVIDPARQKAEEVKTEVTEAKEELKSSVDGIAARLAMQHPSQPVTAQPSLPVLPSHPGAPPQPMSQEAIAAMAGAQMSPEAKMGAGMYQFLQNGGPPPDMSPYDAALMKGSRRRQAISGYVAGFTGITPPKPEIPFVGPPTPEQAEAMKQEEIHRSRQAALERRKEREREGRQRMNQFMFGGRR
ncbi:hypothetical protein [Tautonia rosea]|uniref:hypothetical protein n=1 Tax=Tautonia rosea TaxID=2728037 RepID=UPI001474F3F1|nr:hypothetical protein [Tautonia rosea]